MAQNIFATGMDAFDRSYDRGQTMQQDRARMQAGRSLASGDRQGAAQAFGQAGLTDDVRQVQGDQMRVDDRAQAQQQGAQAQEQAAADRRAKLLVQVAQGLKTVPAGQRKAALGQIAPVFQQVGVDASMFDQLTEDQLTDQSLDMFSGEVSKAAEQYTLAPGSKRFGADGKLIAEAPFAPQYRALGEGQSLVQIGGEPEAAPADWLSGVSSAAPDAQVTSGQRDPARNAEVGGKPNSRHLDGSAVDLVPRPGETMQQLYARVRGVPGTKALNERDHVHVQSTAPRAAGGARVIAQGAPKAAKENAPPSGYKWGANGALTYIPGGPADPAFGRSKGTDNRKGEADLRKEFNQRPEVKEYRDVATSYAQISSLASKPPTAAGDLSLIFSYMKMLDPGSVVREGEFATAQNAAGVPDQIRNLYNRAQNGQRLNPNQRGDFLGQAKSIHDTRARRFGEIASEYRTYATDYGLDPGRIASAPAATPQPRVTPTAAPAAPKVGEVRKGYRFAGGDPSNPRSWTKAQ